MNKKQLLKHFKEDVYCRIGVSKIHGVGIIAIRDIPKGINPFRKTYSGSGIRFSYKELQGMNSSVKKIIFDLLVHDKESVLIPARGINMLDVSFYMNHADTGNMITNDDGETFITARKIKKGEELLYRYNTFDQNLLKGKRK